MLDCIAYIPVYEQKKTNTTPLQPPLFILAGEELLPYGNSTCYFMHTGLTYPVVLISESHKPYSVSCLSSSVNVRTKKSFKQNLYIYKQVLVISLYTKLRSFIIFPKYFFYLFLSSLFCFSKKRATKRKTKKENCVMRHQL